MNANKSNKKERREKFDYKYMNKWMNEYEKKNRKNQTN